MYKKEVPKLYKDNFPTCKSLMKLHIIDIGDTTWTSNYTSYTTITGTLIAEELKERNEHNQEMLEIASVLTYSEYEDINNYGTTKLIWDTLAKIYGGDTNVKRSKAKSLRGKFDDIKMLGDETIAQYYVRVKDVANAIREAHGRIEAETI